LQVGRTNPNSSNDFKQGKDAGAIDRRANRQRDTRRNKFLSALERLQGFRLPDRGSLDQRGIKSGWRGAYIATYRGRRIATEEADRRAARGASYMFEVNKRWTIDGSPRWNVARYINHSCRPNAKPVGRKGGIVIVALRQIEPGEEITYDYGREYLKCFLDNRASAQWHNAALRYAQVKSDGMYGRAIPPSARTGVVGGKMIGRLP
jgi:SET domain-containing protein